MKFYSVKFNPNRLIRSRVVSCELRNRSAGTQTRPKRKHYNESEIKVAGVFVGYTNLIKVEITQLGSRLAARGCLGNERYRILTAVYVPALPGLVWSRSSAAKQFNVRSSTRIPTNFIEITRLS